MLLIIPVSSVWTKVQCAQECLEQHPFNVWMTLMAKVLLCEKFLIGTVMEHILKEEMMTMLKTNESDGRQNEY